MSNKSEQKQVEWLIQQIRDLDRLIAMHQSGNSEFMAKQYATQRLEYFKELISLLATSKFNTTGRETFPLIHALTKEHYVKPSKAITKPLAVSAFEQTLRFYSTRSETTNLKSSSVRVTKGASIFAKSRASKSSSTLANSRGAKADKPTKSSHK